MPKLEAKDLEIWVFCQGSVSWEIHQKKNLDPEPQGIQIIEAQGRHASMNKTGIKHYISVCSK